MALGSPPDVEDILGNKISVNDPIAYGAGDGYLHFGIVRAVNQKVKSRYDWQTKTDVDYWHQSLRVELEKSGTDRYPGARHTNLTRITNVVVLDGKVGARVIKDIEESWVDKGL